MIARSLVRRAVALLIVVAIAATIVLTRMGGSDAVASLKELREREVILLDEEHIYLVYNDGDLLALSTDAQHVGDKVKFCHSSQMFASPAHGEIFDIHGYYYGGPAARGLSRYRVWSEEDGIYVDDDKLLEGPARGHGPIQDPQGPLCDA